MSYMYLCFVYVFVLCAYILLSIHICSIYLYIYLFTYNLRHKQWVKCNIIHAFYIRKLRAKGVCTQRLFYMVDQASLRDRPGFESRLWASYFTSLNVSVFTYKIEMGIRLGY